MGSQAVLLRKPNWHSSTARSTIQNRVALEGNHRSVARGRGGYRRLCPKRASKRGHRVLRELVDFPDGLHFSSRARWRFGPFRANRNNGRGNTVIREGRCGKGFSRHGVLEGPRFLRNRAAASNVKKRFASAIFGPRWRGRFLGRHSPNGHGVCRVSRSAEAFGPVKWPMIGYVPIGRDFKKTAAVGPILPSKQAGKFRGAWKRINGGHSFKTESPLPFVPPQLALPHRRVIVSRPRNQTTLPIVGQWGAFATIIGRRKNWRPLTGFCPPKISCGGVITTIGHETGLVREKMGELLFPARDHVGSFPIR